MTKIRDKVLLEKFGDRVRKLRDERAISQYELAALCNIEQSQIKRIEKGVLNTTLSTISALAKGFEISMSQLLDFEQ